MNRDEFNAKQDGEKIQKAMNQCAVIQFESGAYFKGLNALGNVEKSNVLAAALSFVIGGEALTMAQKGLTIRGEYYQVVILGRVGALP